MDIEYFPKEKVLLVHGHEPTVVAHLREQVAGLAAEQIDSFAVHELPGFRSVEGCQLFAQRDTFDHGMRPDREPQVFRCRLRPATWENIKDMLEPFRDGSYFGAGHQFLDHHGTVTWIISGERGW